MKRIILLFVAVFAITTIAPEAQAQGFLNRLKDKVVERVKEKIEDKVDRTVDKAADDVLDGNSSKKSKKSKKNKQKDYEEEDDFYSSSYDNDSSSSYDEDDSSVASADDPVTQHNMSNIAELLGLCPEGHERIALIRESDFSKIEKSFEGRVPEDLQTQLLTRQLNEEGRAFYKNMYDRFLAASIGKRWYTGVHFVENTDLIVCTMADNKPDFNGKVYGGWGVMDYNGKTIIPFEHFQFTNNAPAMDCLLFVKEKGGKEGGYHLDGRLRIPFKYDDIHPWRTKHKVWFITYENGKNVLYDENMNKKLTADYIDILLGTLNGKDDLYIYTYNGTGSAKVWKNYDENLNLMEE